MQAAELSDRDLSRLLDEQIDAMRAVLASLQVEREALSARDPEKLLEAVSRKAASVAAADEADRRRQGLLERLGITERPGSGRRGPGADDGIGRRWQQVLALTRECRALNDANGQLIRGRQRRVDGALRILRGGLPAATEYDPRGTGRTAGSPRPLSSC